MICILGCSASGKTTLERELCKHGYNRIISYTSRPKRTYETNHVDYHFVSDEDFNGMWADDQLAENVFYNSWQYGIAKEDCVDDAVAVVETSGWRQLKKNPELNIISFYIQVPERIRVVRMMQRGDNVMESFRRIISDQGSFNGIQREVDYVINNDRPLQETVDEILSILQKEAAR